MTSSTKLNRNMVKFVDGIPIFDRPKVNNNEPFLNCVARAVREVRPRVTEKSPNSFLFIASNGKDLSCGVAGQEEDILKGLVHLLDKNDTVRKLLLTHYNNKQQQENGREQEPGTGADAGAVPAE